jgi:diadenosine tetraphosphate (Ap4A) HIT family hydrolase
MPLDPQCIFCRIVRGEAEASLVYRDSEVTAFMDLNPITPGHLLIVPNDHFPDFGSLDPAAGSRMMSVAHQLARALRRAPLAVEGLNLHLADGAVAGQVVFHCHLHIIPRYSGDGFGFRRGAAEHGRDRAELDRVASLIRSGMADGGEG